MNWIDEIVSLSVIGASVDELDTADQCDPTVVLVLCTSLVVVVMLLSWFSKPLVSWGLAFPSQAKKALEALENALTDVDGSGIRMGVYFLAVMTTLRAITGYSVHPLEFIYVFFPENEMGDYYRSPIVGVLYHALSSIGWSLDLELSAWWHRLPNVLLAAVLCRMMFSLGKLVGRPLVGFYASILFIFHPAFVEIRAVQQHYFLEFVCSAWFFLAITRYLTGHGHKRTEIVMATFASIASGYMTASILVPGYFVMLVYAIRRRDLVWFAWTALLAGLVTSPLVIHALYQASGHIFFSQAAGHMDTSSLMQLAENKDYGHVQSTVEGFGGSVLRTLQEILSVVIGARGGWIIVLMAFIIVARSAVAWVAYLPCMTLSLLAGTMHVSPLNTATVWPLLLFVFVWGIHDLLRKLRTIHPRAASLFWIPGAILFSVNFSYHPQLNLIEKNQRDRLHALILKDSSIPVFVLPGGNCGFELACVRCAETSSDRIEFESCVNSVSDIETPTYDYQFNYRARVGYIHVRYGDLDWKTITPRHLCDTPFNEEAFLLVMPERHVGIPDAGPVSSLVQRCTLVGYGKADVIFHCAEKAMDCEVE